MGRYFFIQYGNKSFKYQSTRFYTLLHYYSYKNRNFVV